MKQQNKFKVILSLNDSDLKLSKLSSLAFKTFPNSIIQKEIIKEYERLLSLGYKETIPIHLNSSTTLY
jgi:hypothetical protein